jgi:hypothetical protein|tara:strand:+ start:280 stop:468 length:189 start_codon:yes stop_codon:yes gene_type:complete
MTNNNNNKRVNVMKFEIGMEVLIDGFRWAIVEEVHDDGEIAIVIDQDGADYEVGLDNVDFLR